MIMRIGYRFFERFPHSLCSSLSWKKRIIGNNFWVLITILHLNGFDRFNLIMCLKWVGRTYYDYNLCMVVGSNYSWTDSVSS